MIWPFSRKPKPLNPGPINEDWRVGDLAECVAGDWDNPEGIGPERGDFLAVTDIRAGRGTWSPRDGWFLRFSTYYDLGFDASAFRKVPPLNSQADAEFCARIKGIKPGVRV